MFFFVWCPSRLEFLLQLLSFIVLRFCVIFVFVVLCLCGSCHCWFLLFCVYCLASEIPRRGRSPQPSSTPQWPKEGSRRNPSASLPWRDMCALIRGHDFSIITHLRASLNVADQVHFVKRSEVVITALAADLPPHLVQLGSVGSGVA